MELPIGAKRTTFSGLPATELFVRGCRLIILDLGAQPVSWNTNKYGEIFWRSDLSKYEVGKAVRGGDPRCGPWFGNGINSDQNPLHGPLRLMEWKLTSVFAQESGSLLLTYELDIPLSLGYGQSCRAEQVFAYDGYMLKSTSWLVNTGGELIAAEDMAHPYFSVSSVHNIQITGLEKLEYRDGISQVLCEQAESSIVFPGTREVNHRYALPEGTGSCVIVDPGLSRKITVDWEDASTLVVWQVGTKKAVELSDFSELDWAKTVAVETGFAREGARMLKPGEKTFTRRTYVVEKL